MARHSGIWMGLRLPVPFPSALSDPHLLGAVEDQIGLIRLAAQPPAISMMSWFFSRPNKSFA
jgi:hypothetical protein